MNDLMHIVAHAWYRLYWWVILFITAAFTAGAVAFYFFPDAAFVHQFGTLLHLDTTTLIIALIGLGYELTGYWFVQRSNPTLAILIASMLLTLLTLNGLAISDPGSGVWVYVGIWLLIAFSAGMFGVPFPLGFFLLTIMYILLTSRFQLMGASNASWFLLASTGLAGGLGYLFWKPKYTDTIQSQQFNRLSGMLRSNQEQSAILIQSIADGVIVTSTDGKITLINPTAAKMTAWSVGEAMGIDAQAVVSLTTEKGEPLIGEANPFTAALSQKKHINQTAKLVSRDGKQRIISLVVSPVMLSKTDLAGAVAVLRDISSERAAEQQRGEFISTASHEMRTPVAAIEGYLALALNDKVSTVDSRGRGYLEKAHASTQHLGRLFQDLLTSAKAEDGRLSNHPAVIEMGGFLEQLVEDLRISAQKKGLATDFSIGTAEAIDATKQHESLKVVKPLYYVQVDPDRMREVISNIFDNAVKYTEQGKISIGITGDKDVVQFYIRDTGQGIPADDIPHLFQKFYRVDNSATRPLGGTGLGLFIAGKIVELYQGRIWVESVLGRGSTFFVNLPRLTTQRAEALKAAQAPTPAAAAAPGGNS